MITVSKTFESEEAAIEWLNGKGEAEPTKKTAPAKEKKSTLNALMGGGSSEAEEVTKEMIIAKVQEMTEENEKFGDKIRKLFPKFKVDGINGLKAPQMSDFMEALQEMK